ncbi:hypothetical protein OHB55_23220 [Micromonospora ureilytica]|nr:hypothetical protein OHB55_23220 [Micromonospora ureilytica]
MGRPEEHACRAVIVAILYVVRVGGTACGVHPLHSDPRRVDEVLEPAVAAYRTARATAVCSGTRTTLPSVPRTRRNQWQCRWHPRVEGFRKR